MHSQNLSCPNCHRELTDLRNFTQGTSNAISHGDVLLCGDCATVVVFDVAHERGEKRITTRLMTEDEYKTLAHEERRDLNAAVRAAAGVALRNAKQLADQPWITQNHN